MNFVSVLLVAASEKYHKLILLFLYFWVSIKYQCSIKILYIGYDHCRGYTEQVDAGMKQCHR